MTEKKQCLLCKEEVIVINCHSSCENCGFSENCHDMLYLIDDDEYFFIFCIYMK